jgi:hypothetical protein
MLSSSHVLIVYPCVLVLQLSPGTRRILARKQALCINAGEGSPPGKATGSDSNQASPKHPDFLHRLQQESDTHASSGGGSSMGAPATPLAGARQPARTTAGGSSGGGSACDECTFRPRITPKAAAKKARSVTEMSEGDRLRREVRLVSCSGLNEHHVLNQCSSRLGIKAYTQALFVCTGHLAE